MKSVTKRQVVKVDGFSYSIITFLGGNVGLFF